MIAKQAFIFIPFQTISFSSFVIPNACIALSFQNTWPSSLVGRCVFKFPRLGGEDSFVRSAAVVVDVVVVVSTFFSSSPIVDGCERRGVETLSSMSSVADVTRRLKDSGRSCEPSRNLTNMGRMVSRLAAAIPVPCSQTDHNSKRTAVSWKFCQSTIPFT